MQEKLHQQVSLQLKITNKSANRLKIGKSSSMMPSSKRFANYPGYRTGILAILLIMAKTERIKAKPDKLRPLTIAREHLRIYVIPKINWVRFTRRFRTWGRTGSTSSNIILKAPVGVEFTRSRAGSRPIDLKANLKRFKLIIKAGTWRHVDA